MNKEKKKENKFNIDKDKIVNKMQSISLKVVDLARIVIIILSIMLLVLIAVKAFYKTGYFPATYDNAIEKTDYKYDNIFENLVYITVILFIIYLLHKLLEKVKLKYVIPIVLILLLSLFIWFVISVRIVPIADQGQIMILGDASYKNILNLHIGAGSYLDMFPYQFGFAYYVGVVIGLIDKIKNVFNLDAFVYLQILNGVYSIICMIFMYLIGNRLINKDDIKTKNILRVLILLFSVYFIFLNTHVYAIIPGLMFALLAFLCTIRFIQDGNWYDIVVASISIFIAVFLKTNYKIFLIGILGILGLELLKKIELKKFLSLIIVFVIYVSGSNVGDYIFKTKIQRDIPLGVPMMTYMYMGWAPSNTLSSGWYTGDVINIYNKNEFKHIETAEETKDLIEIRFNHFMGDLKELWRYAWDKFDSTWLNPTFQTIWCATPGLDRIYNNEEYKEYVEKDIPWLIDVVSYDSDVYHIEERLFDSYEIIILGAAILSVVCILKNKEKESENLLLLVTFLGGAVFHFVLWETKAVYVIGYFYLLLPYAAKGLSLLFDKFEIKIKEIKDKKIKQKENIKEESKIKE